MGPELSTAAADQTFAWICKQHQDLIVSVLIFRTKIIWSGPEFGLVRCGYLNAANTVPFGTKNLVRTKAGPAHVQGPQSDRIWSSTKSGYVNAPCSSDQTKSLTFGGKSQSSATKMANWQCGAYWSNDETLLF